MKKTNKFKAILAFVLLVLGAAICSLCRWYNATFDVSLKTLLYTLVSPLTGTSNDVVFTALKNCLPPVIIAVLCFIVIYFFLSQQKVSVTGVVALRGNVHHVDFLYLFRRIGALFCAVAFFASIIFAAYSLQVIDYVKSLLDRTTIYDDYYIDPAKVKITQSSTGKPKNLIYIYMESMETSYASVELGGTQAINYIPNLTNLAVTPPYGVFRFLTATSLLAASTTLPALAGQWALCLQQRAAYRSLFLSMATL